MKYDLNKMLKDARKEAYDLNECCYIKDVIEIFASKLNVVINELAEK